MPESVLTLRTAPAAPATPCPASLTTSSPTGRGPAHPAVMALGAALFAPGFIASADVAAVALDVDALSDETTRLDEMVVEGSRGGSLASPKFTAPLIDTPQTIAVVPKEIFTQQGATTLSDVLRNTPGITFAAGEGGNVASGDSFYMRGFDASSSIFIDGVRDTGAYSRDTFNIEQVEIAKGPAGADTGRGGSSGYINLVTKSPQASVFTTAQAQIGLAEDGDEQRRATLDFNTPLRGSAALRVNALWQDSGVPGREHIENTSWGIAPSFAVGVNKPTRFILAAAYVEQDNIPDSGLPIVALPGGTGGVIDQSNSYGLAGEDFEKVESLSLLARFEHDFSADLRLTNQTKFASTDRDALTSYIQNSSTTPSTFPVATTPVNPATGAVPPTYTTWVPATGTITARRLRNQQDNEIVSNLTNVAGQFATGAVEHSATAGLELSREEQFTPTWSPVGGPATNLANPDPYRTATAAQTPYRASNHPFADARIDTAALYAFDTLELTPRWLLNASARVERYDIDYTSLAVATPNNPSPVATPLSASDELFSWKAGVIFKPTPASSLYAAYADSATPPGAGFALSSTANNQNDPNVDPQESRNYEIGLKWDLFEKRLSTSLALYRSENLNVVSTDAVTGLPTQDISQVAEGIEAGISGRLTAEWLVYGGFGYIDTEYRAAGTTSSGNDGAELRFTPRLSGNLWTTYALPHGFTIGGGVQYTDSVLRSTSNSTTPSATAAASVPDSTVINALAAYAVNSHLTLRLNVNNVFDDESFRLNNNGGRYYPTAPRTFLLTADLSF